jgi:undecaprenyl-diphosphatase
MNWYEAIVLGLIQGFTEFLPVSSSGHMEIGKVLFGINAEENLYFTIAVHGATVLSTLVVFRKEIISLLKNALKFTLNEETIYILKIIVSMIPVGLAGLFLRARIEALYSGNMVLVGFMLLVTSSLLAIGHFIRRKEKPVGFMDAFIIGVAQAIAVIPGISRSGATISTGMILGNRKDELARFSFLMVLIPVIGANVIEFLEPGTIQNNTASWVILLGALAAFVSGFLACTWMINLVRRSKLIWFAVYCLVIGLLTLLFG